GNSEIGIRRLYSQPSVFRAICMNGCIWDAEKGTQLSVVHKGNTNLADLASAIESNLQSQIPLLSNGVDKLLDTRQLSCDRVNPVKVLFTFSKLNKLSNKEIRMS